MLSFKSFLIHIITCFILLSQSNYSQDKPTIVGKIIDYNTGEVLRGASVLLVEAKKGAYSDVKGEFKIKNVETGVYTFKVSYIGYQPQIIERFEVKPVGNNKPTTISLVLEATQTKDVIVTTTRANDNALAMLNQRKNSSQVSDGISSEEIKKLPDGDAGQALKRVSGVTLVGDKFIYVRGVSERYSNTTLNGSSLATTEPDKKSFSFDMFPADFLENANVVKSFTPDLPGNFAGGLVQLNTIDFPTERRVKFNLSNSISDNVTFKDNKFMTYSGGKNDWMGIDDGTRAFPNNPLLSKSNFDRLRQDMRSSDNSILLNSQLKYQEAIQSFNNGVWSQKNIAAPMNTGLNFSYLDIFEVAGNDLGMSAAAVYNYGYSYNDIYRANINGDASKSIDDSRNGSQSTYSTNLGGIFNLAYKIGSNNSISLKNSYNVSSDNESTIVIGQQAGKNESYKQFGFQFLEKKLFASNLKAEHTFEALGNSSLDWNLGFSNSQRNEPDFRRVRYSKPIGAPDSTYLVDIGDLPAGSGSSVGRFFSNLNESAYSSGFNFNIPIETAKLKFGVNYEAKDRDFTARSMTIVKSYNVLRKYIIIDGLDTLRDTPVENLQDDFDPTVSGKFGINSNMHELFNSQNFGVHGLGYSEDSQDRDSYRANENVLAAYVMGSFNFTMFDAKFRAVTGLRIENSQQNLTSYYVDSNIVNKKYNDFLPALSLVYELSSEMNLRTSLAQTLTRPSLREYAPFTFYDFQSKLNVKGNPNLQRALIQNYDVRWEWYPNLGEMFSVGTFLKTFNNAIEETIEITPGGFNRTFGNAQGIANNYGVELEARKSLSFITDMLSDFAFNVNASIVKSQVTITQNTKTETRPMWGQSPYTVNVGLYYTNQNTGTSFSLGYNTYGKRIIQVADINVFKFDNPHVYELSRNIVDVSISQLFFERLEAKLVLKDILAEPLNWEQGGIKVSSNLRGRGVALSFGYAFK
jgi:TonB-dependent receptor